MSQAIRFCRTAFLIRNISVFGQDSYHLRPAGGIEQGLLCVLCMFSSSIEKTKIAANDSTSGKQNVSTQPSGEED